MTKFVSNEKESDNVESASSKEEVVTIVDNSTQNVVFETDIEDEPNTDFYNTPKVPNDEDEPSSSDFNYTPKLPIISNVADCVTQTSNDKSLCSKLFMRITLRASMMNILNLNTMFSQNVMLKPNKLKKKMIVKTKFLKIRLIT